MADAALGKKLGLKPGQRQLVLNAPQGYIEKLTDAPDTIATTAYGEDGFDFVQVFVHNKADVERLAPAALQALKPGGLLWLTYPKKTALKTDISRDAGWESVNEAGYRIVAMVAIDETWSAGRFRPYADVKAGGGR